MAQSYLDFLIDVSTGDGLTYPIVVRSPAGEARTTSPFAFTAAELENYLLRVENALLRGAGQRRTILTPEEDAVRTFDQRLFGFLLTGEPRKRDYVCLDPNTPLVRYTELAQTVAPLPVTLPLRILGMVAAPRIS
ncbi:MAG: hypothetical protein U0350_31410 [Caldilineaceae bacterium]